MELFKKTTVIDWHEHVWFLNTSDELDIELCDRQAKVAKLTHIDKMKISIPSMQHDTPERVEKRNDAVHEAIQRHPDLYMGFCFVDPHHGKHAIAEIERCVKKLGFVGVKLYHQCRLDDPLQYKIIEKSIELDIPVLMHAGKGTPPFAAQQPNLSDSTQFATIARRYPEAVLLMGHVGGGGDWHWQLKGVEDCENVFIDISGSIYDQGIIEATVAAFGADRVLFGSDGSYSSSIGKLIGAEISREDKITILNGPRFAKYINKGGN